MAALLPEATLILTHNLNLTLNLHPFFHQF